MTRTQSLTFRALLFLCGAGVTALAFFLNTAGKSLTSADIFTWLSIGLMYLIFSVPLFFPAVNGANASHKIPSLAILWTGITGFIIASIVVIMLLSSAAVSLSNAITIQAALLFLFAVCVYLGSVASSHSRQIGEEEHKKRQFITGLKARAQVLALSVNDLPVEYEGVRKTIKQTLEEIKYLFPVDELEGFDLEFKIMDALNSISDICDSGTAGTAALLETEARRLQMLIKERKLLRN